LLLTGDFTSLRRLFAFFESNECNDDFATPKAHSLEAISRSRQATAVSTVRASLERKDKTILFAYRIEQ